MRVLAAYGLDDIPKMNPERTFVKSIFLLQMLQYDDQDAPEDTIIHDLAISNVRPPPHGQSASTCFHLPANSRSLTLHSKPTHSLEEVNMSSFGSVEGTNLALK